MNDKKKYVIGFIAILILSILGVIAGVLFTQSDSSSNINSTDNDVNGTKIAATEVSAHNSKDSCWMIIQNSVYDVTAYIKSHPGGNFILEGCGKDATALFNGESTDGARTTDHSNTAKNLLKQYKIGVLSN